MLDVAVLMLVFNRVETTERVFERVRQARPRYLYVVADGARSQKAGEAEKCEAVRQIFTTRVDWECTVVTLFRAENWGCRKSVSDGITWFFSQVEEGIILEDDCLPNESFFTFCAAMLAKYRADNSVMHVSGCQLIPNAFPKQPNGYFFSRIPYIWGWATWRRAWQAYDAEMESLPNYLATRGQELEELGAYLKGKFLRNFEQVKRYELNTWDYQWTLSILRDKGKCIVPAQNLISNIGFGAEATHTATVSHLANQQTVEMRPNYVFFGAENPNFAYDKRAFLFVYGQNVLVRGWRWFKTKFLSQ